MVAKKSKNPHNRVLIIHMCNQHKNCKKDMINKIMERYIRTWETNTQKNQNSSEN